MRLCQTFVSVGEKPSFLALRVGKRSASKTRPTLTGNGPVNQILMKARRLRTVESKGGPATRQKTLH